MPVYEYGFEGHTLNAKVLNVYDACVFKAQFKLSSKIQVTCKCRLVDTDCPRMTAREREAGKAARLHFMGLLRQLSEDEDEGYFPVTCHGHVMGQVLVTIPWDETCSVADIMVSEGHARPMTGGHRKPWSTVPKPKAEPKPREAKSKDKKKSGHKKGAEASQDTT